MNNDLSSLSHRIDVFATNNLLENAEIENDIDELFDGNVAITRLKSKYEFHKQRKMYASKSVVPKRPDNTLNILKTSLKQLHEMEQVGTETLNNLRQQGEQIKAQKEKVEVVNAEIKTSNSILNRLKSWWR